MAADTSLRAFLELMSGHAVVRSIGVVAELGVPDVLANGPMSAADIASRCGANEDALSRVMRTLAAVGLFTEGSTPLRYGLTPLSELLRSDSPRSLRDFARLRGGPMSWSAWGALDHAVRTGGAAFEHAHGASAFEYLEKNPCAARMFDDGMRSLSRHIDAAVVEGYDFSPFTKLIDVGGGRGGLLAAILRAHPHLTGILLDQAAAIGGSGELLRASGVADRCQAVVGDFFAPLPSGADGAILSHVVHNWDDDGAVRILRNCRDALTPTGKVLILEYVLTDDAVGVAAKLFDLQMLVYFGGGRERTVEGYRVLLERAGFALTRIIPTHSPASVVEGILTG
jgi:SAM-dependent methyltransferase